MLASNVANSDIVVGSITLDGANFKLACINHFSAGDKFGIEVSASQSLGKDKISIGNDTGNTRTWTFNSGAFNSSAATCQDKSTALKAYYVNGQNGDAKDATLQFPWAVHSANILQSAISWLVQESLELPATTWQN